MPSVTLLAAASDGYIRSGAEGTYAVARSGSGTLVADNADFILTVGQRNTFSVREGFLSFDTSSLAGKTIDSVVLSVYLNNDSSTTDFTLEARAHSWSSGGLTTADWVAGASLSGKTLLASVATSTFSGNGYYDLTSDAAFRTAINQSGATDLILVSSRTTAGTAPTGAEDVDLGAADDVNPAKLVVVYDTPTLETVVTSPMRW